MGIIGNTGSWSNFGGVIALKRQLNRKMVVRFLFSCTTFGAPLYICPGPVFVIIVSCHYFVSFLELAVGSC